MELKHVCNRLLWLRGLPRKTILAMRFTTLILLAGFLHVSARGHAQEKITLSAKNISLKKAFSKIREQSGYSIWYDEVMLEKTGKIDIELKNATVEEAIDYCCRNQPLTYSIVGKMVIIKSKEDKKDKDPPPALDLKGKILNEKEEPLPGATISIKGTTRSIQTDGNGEFILTGVTDKTILVVSNVGYETQEIKPGNNIHLIIRLAAAVSKLDEVQVIAYGTTTQRLNTGSVSTVTAEEIGRQPVSNPLEALEGRMPGVYIQQSTGVSGGGFTLEIRGENSLRRFSPNNGNLPLYIIDGVPFTSTSLDENTAVGGQIVPLTSPLNSINPADIESIDILKDADATAIYGSRGSNGVVLITTKKGKAGKTKVNINVYSGGGKITRTMNLLNASQYLEMRTEALKNDGLWPLDSSLYQYVPDVFLWDTTRYTDWQKFLIGNTAKTLSVQASASGGNTNTQFLIGGGYFRQTTVFPGDFSNQKGSGHFNLNHISENAKFKSTLSVSYVVDINDLPWSDPTSQALSLAPDAPAIYNADGTLNWANSSWVNPFSQFLQKYSYNTNNFIANALFSYELWPGLQLKTNLGYNNIQMQQTVVYPISSQNPANSPTGGITAANNSTNTWIVEPQAEYQKNIGRGKLSILAGTTFQQNVSQSQSVNGSGYTSDALLQNLQAAPSVRLLNSIYTQYRYNAVFGRINYNWDDKYLVNLTGRRDGSSRFGPGKQFANFGAVGAGWIFSKENFIKNSFSFLSFGKLRASYGITGSDQIGDYQYLDTYSSTAFPYNGTSGLILTRLVNPDYAWETTKKLEFGLELGFLKDHILFSTSYYLNRSSNQLVGYPLPVITGQSSVQANLPAVVQNEGWEFTINTINLKSKKISWSNSLNLTLPNNKLISYPGLSGSSYAYTYVVGQPLHIKYGYKYDGVDPETGLYQFADKTGKPTTSPLFPDDYIYTKKIGPDFYGGFQNNLRYGNWEFDLFIQFVKQTGISYLGVFGTPGYLTNQPTIVMNRWRNPGDVTNIQKFTIVGPAGSSYNNAVNSDAGVTDASFIRVKNISLSYHLPSRLLGKIKIMDIRIYIQGQNLFTITKYSGMDPENQSFQSIPPLRMLTGGLQITL